MTIEREFKVVKGLIERNRGQKLADELLSTIENATVNFKSSEDPQTRGHLYDIYSTRQQIQKEVTRADFVDGYEETVSNLKTSDIDEIYTSSYSSEKGTFILFTDRDKTKLVGLLKSKRTLTEIRELYSGHEGQSRYRPTENIFIKGILETK